VPRSTVGDCDPPTRRDLQIVLREHNADQLFRIASRFMARRTETPENEAFVRSRRQLEILLATK